MPQLLFERLNEQDRNFRPDFALNSTLSWIHGLSILMGSEDFSKEELQRKYSGIQRTSSTKSSETTVMSSLFMAINYLASLSVLKEIKSNVNDLARISIISWYYGIFHSANAMLVATNRDFIPDNHTNTANVWDDLIAKHDLIPAPFSYRVSSLIEAEYKGEIESNKDYSTTQLAHFYPQNKQQAKSACLSYLKGTASYLNWKKESEIKESKEFRDLGVSDFRTKKARELRDVKLKRHSCCFLHQASRYRGKANYRDSIYLGYGDNNPNLLNFTDDLFIVLKTFINVVFYYSSKRLEKELFTSFIEDLKKHSNLSISIDSLVN